MAYFLLVFTVAATMALIAATLLASLVGRYGFPLPPVDRRIGCIDGLRGYLALAVMLHHFFIWTNITRMGGAWEPPQVNFLNQLGSGGVALFFMTTGLVFYPRVLSGFRKSDWIAVYVTRVFRILPLVIAAFAVVTIIIILRTRILPGPRDILSAAKWISGWSEPPLMGYLDAGRINAKVLWSLWFEWVFYLSILPLSAFTMDFVKRYQLPSWVVPLGLLGFSLIARAAMQYSSVDIQIFTLLPLFSIGMLAFEIQKRAELRTVLSKPIMAIPAGLSLLVGMIATRFPYGLSMPLFAFFFICVACGNSMGGLLRTRGALVLGECSFGIYLLHGIVLNVLFVDLDAAHFSLSTTTFPALLPIVALVTTVVTPLTYLLVERPAMRQGKLLARLLTGYRAKLTEPQIEFAP